MGAVSARLGRPAPALALPAGLCRASPVGDVRAWRDTLVQLGQSPWARERLGKAAQERVRSEYDFNVVGERYESLYADLLGSNLSAVKALAEVK